MFLVIFASVSFADNVYIPTEAILTISKVNSEAQHKDFEALKLLMTKDFIWSFGGDASLAQAIADWKANPDKLKSLIEATNLPCVLLSDNTVECPNNAGLGYRAGFRLTNTGWRMYYFVQGD